MEVIRNNNMLMISPTSSLILILDLIHTPHITCRQDKTNVKNYIYIYVYIYIYMQS